jgi:putative acyl-CoA dehydrogenase
MQYAVSRSGSSEATVQSLIDQGQLLGSPSVMALGDAANSAPFPNLQTHDNYGNRVDHVKYGAPYHALMEIAISKGATSMPFDFSSDQGSEERGRHVARASLMYMQNAVDPGHCCPLVMSFASIPTLKSSGPEEHKQAWLDKLCSRAYDERDIPIELKKGITIGMSMTEKQGGSDVRANSTMATPLPGGKPGEYSLLGHKWFT